MQLTRNVRATSSQARTRFEPCVHKLSSDLSAQHMSRGKDIPRTIVLHVFTQSARPCPSSSDRMVQDLTPRCAPHASLLLRITRYPTPCAEVAPLRAMNTEYFDDIRSTKRDNDAMRVNLEARCNLASRVNLYMPPSDMDPRAFAAERMAL